MKSYFLLIIICLILVGCSGTENNSSEQKGKKFEKIPASVLENGKNVYSKHCFACHQKDGSGIAGMYPPLSETETVNGGKEKLISIVLGGLSGKIIVKGEVYNHVMIPHDFLSDRQLADLLTYIRTSFGNNAERITENEVEAIRIKYR